jgi:hypothetical protein
MRIVRIIAVVVTVLAQISVAGAAGDQGSATPPITVDGARRVDLRNSTGGLASYYSIPSTSVFRTYGGKGSPCTFTARSDHYTSDGQFVETGQTVQSDNWIFREGAPPSFGEPSPEDPASLGDLATATRSFVIFCDLYDSNHAIGFVQVTSNDPMYDPHVRLTDLYNGLQLIRPIVYRNPIVDDWGGLVTRYPAWLAIQPSAWTPVRSDPEHYRGWTLYLLATPVALDFHIDFDPDPEQPSTPFDGYVLCVAEGETPTADTVALPAVPDLPEQTDPGVNGQCQWTPPGPGTVTIEARLRSTITFWANGYTEALPDYVWTSEPVTHATGELTAVNIDPRTG